MSVQHELWMSRCLQLAALGRGKVSSNPMVGAVVVHNNQIIGEGYHQKYGGPHAEVNAINAVEDKSLLSESTIYVSLEPCSFHGKTPPCADLIIRHNIPKVVVAATDPHPKVAGRGIQRLRHAGIEVTEGILEAESNNLNKRFNTFHQKARPYIILKWAQSADGFFAPEKNDGIHWISSEQTQWLTHKWRGEEDAILVGTQTALTDNPSLTTRAAEGKNPLRVLLDEHGRVPLSHSIFYAEAETLVFSKNKRPELPSTAEHVVWTKENGIQKVLDTLHKRNIQSLIVEGGAQTIQAFIDQGLWDEARVIIGKSVLKKGLKAPVLEGNEIDRFTFGPDSICTFTP